MLGLGTSIISGAPIAWDPSILGSNLHLWLKNGVDIAVGQWNDQSQYSHHAVQGTSGDQAAVSGGGLDFEQSEGDHYDFADSPITIPAANGSTGGYILAMVVNIESYDGTQNGFLSSATDNFLEFQTDDKFRLNYNGTTSVLLPDTNNLWAAGSKFFFTIVRDNDGAQTIYKNGTLLDYAGSGTSNLTNTGTVDINALGCRNKATADRFFDGVIYEVILSLKYDAGFVTDINTYLSEKFSL